MISSYLLSTKRNRITLNTNDNPVMLLLETESLQGSVVEFRPSASTFLYIITLLWQFRLKWPCTVGSTFGISFAIVEVKGNREHTGLSMSLQVMMWEQSYVDRSDGAAGIKERSILRHTEAPPHQHEAEQTCFTSLNQEPFSTLYGTPAPSESPVLLLGAVDNWDLWSPQRKSPLKHHLTYTDIHNVSINRIIEAVIGEGGQV